MDFFGFFRRSRPGRVAAPGASAGVGEAQPDAESKLGHGKVLRLSLPPPPPPTPDEIRRLVFDAVASGDERRLEALCREHHDLILSQSPGWSEVPSQFRTNPDLLNWYENGLRAVSSYCTEKLGR